MARQSFRLVPFTAQKHLMEKALNELFSDAISDGDIDHLAGRYLLIRLNNVPLQWTICFNKQRFHVSNEPAKAQATISGGLGEFILLASRLEDPDTLFFQRRLAIEGDTELGLAVKNLLDTIDLEQIPLPLRLLLNKLGHIHQQMSHSNVLS